MHNILPRHDILEVNSYLAAGLANSPIDAWFDGPIPEAVPNTVLSALTSRPLSAIMKDAIEMTENVVEMRRPSVSFLSFKIYVYF